MIGETRDETLEAIMTLERAAFPFHLNGSRFFGTNTDYSDWDFFCGDHEDIEEWLKLNKFKAVPVSLKEDGDGYGYTNRRAIAPSFFPKIALDAPRQDVTKVLRRGKVDVQMVTDPKMRTQLINWIRDKMPCYRNINKRYHKIVYNFFFDIIYGNVKDGLDYAEKVVNHLFPSISRNAALKQFSAFVGKFS